MIYENFINFSNFYFSSFFISRGSSDVDLVQNAYLKFDESMYIGDAFNSWESCDDTNWEAFETDRGIRVVEYSCVNKGIKAKVKRLMDKDKNPEHQKFLDLDSITSHVQFTINKDDTLNVNYESDTYLWEDGKTFDFVLRGILSNGIIRRIYSNELTSQRTFDANSLERLYNHYAKYPE